MTFDYALCDWFKHILFHSHAKGLGRAQTLCCEFILHTRSKQLFESCTKKVEGDRNYCIPYVMGLHYYPGRSYRVKCCLTYCQSLDWDQNVDFWLMKYEP